MRINSEVSKTYIRNKLISAVNTGSQANQTRAARRNYVYFAPQTSESVQELLAGGERNPIKKIIINLAFKYKNTIKKIPFIGDMTLKIKDGYVKAALSGDFSLIDIKPYLSLHYTVFIPELYKKMLNRLPGEDALCNMVSMVKNGAPNGALVYMVASSPEFRHTRFVIKDLGVYKSLYGKYIFKRRIQKIPILGRIIGLLLLNSQLRLLSEDITFLLSNLSNRIQNMESVVSCLTDLYDDKP